MVSKLGKAEGKDEAEETRDVDVLTPRQRAKSAKFGLASTRHHGGAGSLRSRYL